MRVLVGFSGEMEPKECMYNTYIYFCFCISISIYHHPLYLSPSYLPIKRETERENYFKELVHVIVEVLV